VTISLILDDGGTDRIIEKINLDPAQSYKLTDGQLGTKGEKGDTGDRGEQGIKGEKGDAGERGEAGIKGEKGEAGLQGERGEKGEAGANGKDGENGADGRDGRDGRDAVQIDILGGIDPEKSYPRDTYVSHDGGLWKSAQNTVGMKGWECIVDGIKDVQIEFDGNRSFKMKVLKTSGQELTKEFKVPALIYKEIYRDGAVYEKGDAVTYAGSVFIALEDTEEKPATGSKAWRLAVKAGRNGKDKV